MMAIKKASMCARVTSTYMEFTFTDIAASEFSAEDTFVPAFIITAHMHDITYICPGL